MCGHYLKISNTVCVLVPGWVTAIIVLLIDGSRSGTRLTLGGNAAGKASIRSDKQMNASHHPFWTCLRLPLSPQLPNLGLKNLWFHICRNFQNCFLGFHWTKVKDHVKSILWIIFISLWPWHLSVPDPHYTHCVFHYHVLCIYCTCTSADQGVLFSLDFLHTTLLEHKFPVSVWDLYFLAEQIISCNIALISLNLRFLLELYLFI